MKMEFDASELTAALREYKKATKKDSVSIIKRAMRNICFRAIRFTPAADKSVIRAALTKDELLFKVLNARRVAKGQPALGNTGMSEPAKTFLATRVNSSAYIKSGWFVPLIRMGAHPHNKKRLSKKQERDGGAIEPSTFQLDGIVINGSAGGGDSEAAREGLEKAVADVARDMAEYAAKKMAATATKYSGK